MKYAFAAISALFAGLTGAVDSWFAIPAVYAGFAALDGIVGSQLRAAPFNASTLPSATASAPERTDGAER